MLVLKEGEICPYSGSCKYNDFGSCQGSWIDRKTVFTCEYAKGGIIQDGGVIRNSNDVTGKMKVITDNIGEMLNV